MHPYPLNITSWATSSYGDTADASCEDQASLKDHLSSCKGMHGKLFALHCAAEAIDAHIKSRFITTLVLATVLIGISSFAI
jgi:hypothetical protein